MFPKSNHINSCKISIYFVRKNLLFLFYTLTFTKLSHQFIYSTHLFNKIIISLTQTQVLHLSNPSIESRPLPFVLSFSNLTFNVKVCRKMSLPSLISHRRMPELEVGDSFFTRTKMLLNDSEARDGEILAMLGARGSGKSTLIDALKI